MVDYFIKELEIASKKVWIKENDVSLIHQNVLFKRETLSLCLLLPHHGKATQ